MSAKHVLSEEERQARREEDRRRTREAVEALRSSVGWQAWLGARRHFHRYSLTNQALIAAQMPQATRVAGFRAWLKLGYAVRKGEQAIRVWLPMPPSRKQLAAWLEAGAEKDAMPRTRFRLGPVFDRSQVDPLPPPAVPVPLDPPVQPPEGDSLAWAFPRLVKLAGELRCPVVVERMPDGTGGCFLVEPRVIVLNEASSVNHQVKTLMHELAHVLIRWQVETEQASLTYSQEELVVESVTFVVCASVGLDVSGESVPYVAGWGEDGALEAVTEFAQTIDGLARRIETALTNATTPKPEPVSAASGGAE